MISDMLGIIVWFTKTPHDKTSVKAIRREVWSNYTCPSCGLAYTQSTSNMKQSVKSTLDKMKSAAVIVKRNCKVDLEVFAERNYRWLVVMLKDTQHSSRIRALRRRAHFNCVRSYPQEIQTAHRPSILAAKNVTITRTAHSTNSLCSSS